MNKFVTPINHTSHEVFVSSLRQNDITRHENTQYTRYWQVEQLHMFACLRLLGELAEVLQSVRPADVQVKRVNVLLNRLARAADLLCQLLSHTERGMSALCHAHTVQKPPADLQQLLSHIGT